MPSLFRLLTHPELRRPGPPPLEVDVRKVVLAGLGLWAVALVVALILVAVDVKTWNAVWVCLAGIALGGLGLVWLGRKRGPQGSQRDQAVSDQSA